MSWSIPITSSASLVTVDGAANYELKVSPSYASAVFSNQYVPPPFPLPSFKFTPINPSNIGPDPAQMGAGITETCAFKTVTSGIMGGFLGIVMGIFLGAMGENSSFQIIAGREAPQAPLKEQMRGAYRGLGDKCMAWSRSFIVLTAIFSGTECLVEKYRGKHDVWNPVFGGFFTGIALRAKAGPRPAFFAGVGFAVFSYAIELVMPMH